MTGDPVNGAEDRNGKFGGDGHRAADPSAQRERLIEAFTKLATERGYGAITAEEVAAAAGVSAEAFDEHFEGKRQCLSAAYDAFLFRLLSEAAAGIDTDQDWPLQVKDAVAASLDYVRETATRARFFAVDALNAGPLILDRYMSAIERAVPLLRAGRDHYPEAGDLPEITELVLLGGAACLVSGALLEEAHDELGELEEELVEILLTPYLGRAAARRIAA